MRLLSGCNIAVILMCLKPAFIVFILPQMMAVCYLLMAKQWWIMMAFTALSNEAVKWLWKKVCIFFHWILLKAAVAIFYACLMDYRMLLRRKFLHLFLKRKNKKKM